jgi:hypothetical protein
VGPGLAPIGIFAGRAICQDEEGRPQSVDNDGSDWYGHTTWAPLSGLTRRVLPVGARRPFDKLRAAPSALLTLRLRSPSLPAALLKDAERSRSVSNAEGRNGERSRTAPRPYLLVAYPHVMDGLEGRQRLIAADRPARASAPWAAAPPRLGASQSNSSQNGSSRLCGGNASVSSSVGPIPQARDRPGRGNPSADGRAYIANRLPRPRLRRCEKILVGARLGVPLPESATGYIS